MPILAAAMLAVMIGAVASLATLPRASAAAPPQDDAAAAAEFPWLDGGLIGLLDRGRQVKALERALAQAPYEPATIDLVVAATHRFGAADHSDLILEAARRSAESGEAVEAVDLVVRASRGVRHDFPGRSEQLGEIVASLRRRVAELPREQAAQVVRQLIPLEASLAGGRRADTRPLLREFTQEYAGTEAALLTEVEIIGWTRDIDQEIAQLEAFAREHPGTTAGAAALHAMGAAISNDRRGYREDPPHTDPTERFLKVLAIVRELDSGRWPASPAVDDAHALLARFYVADDDVFAPGNLERMTEAWEQVALEHAEAIARNDPDEQLSWSAPYRLAEIYERQGRRVSGMEELFDALARATGKSDAMSFRKVSFYIDEAERDDVAEREALIDKAFTTLASLADASDEASRRRALATTAALHLYEREYERAIEGYRRYLAQWPESPWTWAATLRMGQAQEAVGDWEAAAETYSGAARTYAGPPPVVVLANALAGRAYESLFRFDLALQHYSAAIPSWDDDYGEYYPVDFRQAPRPGERTTYLSDVFTRADLARRITELAASASYPEGLLLESGRRLLEQERWQDARATLEGLVNGHPASPLAAEARYLAHRARFEQALEIADIEAPQPDEPEAFDELEALAGEPWDPAVGAAQLAVAAILGKSGLEGRAIGSTRAALETWLANQPGYYRRNPDAVPADPSLRADVAAIRNILFQPRGGDLYDDPRARWNAFDFSTEVPPFYVIDPDLTVKLAGGVTTRVRVAGAPPGLDTVLLMDREHLGMLNGILTRLGGTETRPPRAVMETPNQPIGASLEILALWRRFFPARPGHWGGWVLETYPIVTRIEFLDDDRTSANAAVTIGYSGCTVVLEKRDGEWTVVRLTDFWIT